MNQNQNEIEVVDNMRLGNFEFKAMNNVIRRFIQKHVEFKIFNEMLKKHDIELSSKIIMDAGCGSGYSSKLILNKFEPEKIIAFDYMPEQIELARKRDLPIDFFVGDLCSIEQPSQSVDAVFIFGVIHHIEKWQQALKEVFRVLKPQGFFFIEEPHYRFEFKELENEMINIGFSILERKKFAFGYFRSYLLQKK